MKISRDITKVRENTHLRSHIGLYLGALLFLALEDGRSVAGDVLQAVDDLRMLSRDLEVTGRVGIGVDGIPARGGRHGRVVVVIVLVVCDGFVRGRGLEHGGEGGSKSRRTMAESALYIRQL